MYSFGILAHVITVNDKNIYQIINVTNIDRERSIINLEKSEKVKFLKKCFGLNQNEISSYHLKSLTNLKNTSVNY